MPCRPPGTAPSYRDRPDSGRYHKGVTQSVITRPLYRLYERQLERGLDSARLPRHIGVILDGHRRYARTQRLPDYAASYREGMAKFEQFIEWSQKIGIETVTGWVLSPQNMSRPDSELLPYFEVLKDLFLRLPALADHYDLSLRVIGSLDLLPDDLVRAAKEMEAARPTGNRQLNIAMGYGGQQEIVDAARELMADLLRAGITPEEIPSKVTRDSLASHMYLSDLPDAELIIRTSGESRLSGFLLWQSAYAEFSFVDVHWPAFRRVDFLRSLRDFAQRDRRFGQ